MDWDISQWHLAQHLPKKSIVEKRYLLSSFSIFQIVANGLAKQAVPPKGFSYRPMKFMPRTLLTLMGAVALGGTYPAQSAVNADGVVSIDASSTPATILANTGTVDLALNLGATSGATIAGISFTGAVLTAGSPVIGAGATLTPIAPTPAATSLRNLDLNGFLWSNSSALAGVMNDLLDSRRFPAQAGDALNFTITGLDANRFYFIQLLSGDTRAEFENQNYNLGGVIQNGQFGNGGTNDGVLVKYTVTGETALNLTVSNVTGNSPPMLAGVLIRSVEPGIFAPPSASGTSTGVPSTISIPIGNAASVGYNIIGASYSGANAGDFSTGPATPLAIPASGSTNFTVNVTPSAGGTRTATLTLLTDDPTASSVDVTLSVNVLDPVVVIEPALDFGASATLSGPVSDVIFVDNDGGATNLNISTPLITGPGAAAFTVTSLPAPIAPNTFDTIEVAFNPPSPGYYAATLQLATNDPFTPVVTVQLTGELTGNLISPVTVVSVSSENIFGIDRDADHTVDGSGLTGLGSPGSRHSIGETGLAWTSNGIISTPNDLSPQLTYDLGAIYQITKIREWGYNDPTINVVLGTAARIIGPDAVEVFTSKDNTVFTSAGIVHFTLAPGTAGYTGSEIAVSLPAARYIRFEIKSNHAGAIFDGTGTSPGTTDNRGLTGLSEVRFEGSLAPSTPFETWLDGYSLTGGDRAPNADPDHDGVENLLEYAVGGNPTVADPGKLPRATVSGADMEVTFQRPDQVSGVTLRFEASTDLVSWPDQFTIGSSPEVSVIPNDSAPDTITLSLSTTAQPIRFVRLVAELTS
jgi:hypothetical protein